MKKNKLLAIGYGLIINLLMCFPVFSGECIKIFPPQANPDLAVPTNNKELIEITSKKLNGITGPDETVFAQAGWYVLYPSETIRRYIKLLPGASRAHVEHWTFDDEADWWRAMIKTYLPYSACFHVTGYNNTILNDYAFYPFLGVVSAEHEIIWVVSDPSWYEFLIDIKY